MIVGVPDYDQLQETAVGWLNLAWEITIEEVRDYHEAGFIFEELGNEYGGKRVDAAVSQYWKAAQYKLNNAISLLQQSLEIFLKARIAEVSPYLLIAGDPHSWPKADSSGEIDFSNFRTLDAVQLTRVVKLVSKHNVTDSFVEFYDRLRKTRNKISHLNAGQVQAEAKAILIDVLTAYKHLFPNGTWIAFRKQHLDATVQISSENLMDPEDWSHDRITWELDAALDELSPKYIKKFFGYDTRKCGMRCPKCLELRTTWSDIEYTFAQKQKDGRIKCAACLSDYSADEYKTKIMRYFDYLDDNEKKSIEGELDASLP